MIIFQNRGKNENTEMLYFIKWMMIMTVRVQVVQEHFASKFVVVIVKISKLSGIN